VQENQQKMKEKCMNQKVNIIEGSCDYLEDDIQKEYDFSNAKFYNFKSKRNVIEIEPDIYNFFGSPANINHILKTIKESVSAKMY
jgi:hypothetical protein